MEIETQAAKFSWKVLLTPFNNLMLFIGAVFMFFSAFDLNNKSFILFIGTYREPIFWIGCGMFSFAIILHVATFEQLVLLKKYNFQKGVNIHFGKVIVQVKRGYIQDIVPEEESAFVLSTNTSFIDGCVKDPNSAFGSLFIKRHQEILDDVAPDSLKELQVMGFKPDSSNCYEPCTTLFLPKKYDLTPARILLTACATKQDGQGLHSTPVTIVGCMSEIFKITSTNRIEILYMPIIGSGRGGMKSMDALIFMLQAIKYYSSKFHHIRKIIITVHPNSEKELNKEIKRLKLL